MRKFILTSAFVFIILIAASNEIFACTCSNSNEATIEKSFRDSDAVIYGKVIDLSTDPNRDIQALFMVESSWKGVDHNKIIVRTDATSCGINFKIGENYYLWLDGRNDEFHTVPCRRHGGAEENFLQNKPQLRLKTVSLELSGKKNYETEPEEKRPENEDSAISRDLFLIIGASLASAFFVLFLVGIIFFFWRRKR